MFTSIILLRNIQIVQNICNLKINFLMLNKMINLYNIKLISILINYIKKIIRIFKEI